MFDTKLTQRTGCDPFVWFTGVVEDINDPLQLGRVKIRILGDHTQSAKSDRIPTSDLPWAYFVNDVHSSSMQGIGHSPTGMYVKGAWVLGFYWDSEDKQQPVITGSIGGIPESIAWSPQGAEVGFQDPDKVYPIDEYIFEQDTNRLARKSEARAVEIPESLVPPQEVEIPDGQCPVKPELGKQYHDKFDEAYVRKYAHGEANEKTAKVEKKDDKECQYILKNSHPFSVYKFINRERRVPIAKPFADPIHREEWHEPDNPWNTQYPFNRVWEGLHDKGTTSIDSKNKFVSQAYAYNKTIEGYDGSKKEGLHRKITCGAGSWGLGEEWDSTPSSQRYHRFHPAGNYFEIDNDGNQVDKIYGDNFEINVKDKTILIKGDWNVTVEGDKNELIEGNYNLQVMGDINTDVRGNIKTHVDNDKTVHVRGNDNLEVDQNVDLLIKGNRQSTVLVGDYSESQIAERHANSIVRKGATSILDEGFLTFDQKAFTMNTNVCNWNTTIKNWTSKADVLDEDIINYTSTVINLTEEIGSHIKTLDVYDGCIAEYVLHTKNYLLTYETSYEVAQAGYPCELISTSISVPPVTLGTASYCETECVENQCKPDYNACIQAALASCTSTLVDPRTREEEIRVDWEKYHASINSCKRSYDACIETCSGCTIDICDPYELSPTWECMPSHDPNCPVGEKVVVEKVCGDCSSIQERVVIDPWKDLEQEKP